MSCQELACMVTYSVWLFLHLAHAHSPEPAVHLAHSHFQEPATVQVIIHEVPMPWQQYKGMLPGFKGQAGQPTGESNTLAGQQNHTLAIPHTSLSQVMASKSWLPRWPSPAQQGHVNSAVEDITLGWWSQEITSDSNNSRCQTQHVPHYVSPQLLSTLLLERVKQKSQQRKPPSWTAQAAAGLAEGRWTEKATGLLAWEERKEGQACSGSPISRQVAYLPRMPQQHPATYASP